MMINTRSVIVLLLTAALCSCSSVRNQSVLKNHDDDYLQSANLPSLKTPPGVKLYKQDPYYIVPSSTSSSANKTVSLLPPGSYAEQQALAKKQAAVGQQHAKK